MNKVSLRTFLNIVQWLKSKQLFKNYNFCSFKIQFSWIFDSHEFIFCTIRKTRKSDWKFWPFLKPIFQFLKRTCLILGHCIFWNGKRVLGLFCTHCVGKSMSYTPLCEAKPQSMINSRSRSIKSVTVNFP